MDYAATQNNLGNAYRTLGEVDDKAGNCKQAIRSYQEALKIRTLERFPMDYAATHNNLGLAYWMFAEAADKASNCQNAKDCLEESLLVYQKLNMQYDIDIGIKALQELQKFCEGEEEEG
jgi:tetratricopeptide (TPR) repeat protein